MNLNSHFHNPHTQMEPSSYSISSGSTKTGGGLMILILFYALFWVLSKKISSQRKKQQQLPPEAGGAWPVIGHLHLLSGPEPPHKILGKMADVYGPIFTLKLGMQRAVVVSNWEIAKECLTINDAAFASRPKLEAARLLGYNNTMFGFTQYGQFWRHMRKVTALGFLTSQHLKKLQRISESEIQNSIVKIYANKTKNVMLAAEMKTWFGDITLNIMFRMVVGKRFSTSDLDGNNNNNQDYYRKAFRDFVELFGIFVPSDLFPFLSWFDFGGYKKAMKKMAMVLDQLLDKWIKEHRQKKNSGETEDLMDVLLSAVEEDEQLSGYHGDSVVKANCLLMILGGSDSMAVTMIWAISLLLNNEESLKRVQVELDEQVGRDRQVKDSDMQNLIYLQAIVKETLRLYPAGPLSAPHESIEDCNNIGGRYNIPANTRLILNLQKLQRDPLVWEDPNEFRPERFLTKQKDFDVKGQTPQLIPFGSGRRICPGISFALQVMTFTLANFIHEFQIGRPSSTDHLLDMEESFGLTIARKTPLHVVLTPRLSKQAYN